VRLDLYRANVGLDNPRTAHVKRTRLLSDRFFCLVCVVVLLLSCCKYVFSCYVFVMLFVLLFGSLLQAGKPLALWAEMGHNTYIYIYIHIYI